MKYRRAAIVLGAGASKGARIVGGKTPPLDAAFLTTAANYYSGNHPRVKNKAKVQAWKEFHEHLRASRLEFAEVKSWRLEQLSTFLEARASLRGLQLGPGRPRDFSEALAALKVLVCFVLEAEG